MATYDSALESRAPEPSILQCL